jgi:hypothetical protein
VALVNFVEPHLSNIDIFPVTNKKLHEYIFVSPMSPHGYLFPLLYIAFLLVITCLLTCSLLVNSLSSTSREFTFLSSLK